MVFAKRGGVVPPLQEQLDFAFVHVVPLSSVASSSLQRFLHAFMEELAAFKVGLETFERLNSSE